MCNELYYKVRCLVVIAHNFPETGGVYKGCGEPMFSVVNP